MVIEMLTFQVAESERAAWMEVEERTWSRYLEQCAGFLRKQMWVDDERPDEIHAVIWWESEELWYTIAEADIARVDAEMGPWFREGVMRKFQMVRDC